MLTIQVVMEKIELMNKRVRINAWITCQ